MKKVIEILKQIYGYLKIFGSLLSKNFKDLFLNIPAAIAWLSVLLIIFKTNGFTKILNPDIITLYTLILILVLAVKVGGK